MARYVSSGKTSTGLTINGPNAQLYVEDGGTAVDTTASHSGYVDVASGGTAIDTTLTLSGEQDIESGGLASSTLILSGGEEDVFGSSIDASVSSGGLQNVALEGGVASGTTVYAGGDQELGDVIMLGDTPTGAISIDTVLSGGEQDIDGGSTASNTVISSGGLQLLGLDLARIDQASDMALGTTVYAGGAVAAFTLSGVKTFYDSSGGLYATVSGGPGTEVITYGPAEGSEAGYVGSLVQDGGEVYATLKDANGNTVATTSNSGYINLPGIVSNATIESGGAIYLAGGQTPGLTMLSGAIEIVGGPISANLAGDGELYTIDQGAVVISGNVVGSGVIEKVSSGGVDVSGYVGAVASEVVFSGGIVSSATVQYGGRITVLSGGIADGVLVGSSAAELDVSSGGVASNVTVLSGGVGVGPGVLQGSTDNAGSIYRAVVSGSLTVSSGGLDRLNQITSGAVVTVLSGGETDDIVQSGGVVNLSDGAIVGSGEYVSSGGPGVEAGGVMSGPGVVAGGFDDAGQVYAVVVTGSGSLNVKPGGIVGATVSALTPTSSGGYKEDHIGIYVSSGGEALGVTVGASGYLELDSGGQGDLVTVQGGGLVAGPPQPSSGGGSGSGSGSGAAALGIITQMLTVSSGGTAENLQISSGASDVLFAGGKESKVYVSSAATLLLIYDLVGSGATITAGTEPPPVSSASSAATISGAVLFGGARVTTLSATVRGGGALQIASGGVATATIVSSGGTETVLAGGAASGGSILKRGLLVVSSGGAVAGVTVASGGTDRLYVGGLQNGVVVSSGGILSLAGLVLNAGQSFTAGPVATSGSVSGATLASGALLAAYSATVASGGLLQIASGGSATGTIVSNGGAEVVSRRGEEFGAVILSGGILAVSSGGTASGAVIFSGGVELAAQGFVDSAATLSSGATLELQNKTIYSGHTLSIGPQTGSTTLSGATLQAGAMLEVLSGTVASGGAAIVFSRGVALGETIAAGGAETVVAGGSASGGVVSGVLAVGSHGSASGIAIAAGGVDVLSAGALETRVIASSGATLELVGPVISSGSLRVGPVASAMTVSGVTLQAGAGLTTTAAVLGAGGKELVGSGGVASATVVSHGGAETVSAGGLAIATFVAGGVETALSGGVAENTFVASGGTEIVASGGVASGATVSAGGLLSGAGVFTGLVDDFGAVARLKAASGAILDIEAGATSLNVGIMSGATLIDDGTETFSGAGPFTLDGVLSGNGVLVEDGPGVLVQSASTTSFSGTAVISSGVLELATAGGLADAPVIFAGGSATLQLQKAAAPKSGKTFAETLSNFSGTSLGLDLRQQAYVSGASATVSSGALTVHDGGYTAHFSLAGATASSFVVASDGHGGTLITPSASAVSAMTEAIAQFGDVGAPNGVRPVSSGGSSAALIADPSAPFHRSL